MPNQKGTAQYRFRAGFDGISEFSALEISGGKENQEPEKFRAANDPYETKVSGHMTVEPIVIKLVIGHDQNAIDDLNRWFDDFFNDVDKTRRSGFVDDMDEAGRTPVMSREFTGCIPVTREHDQRSTDGKGVATVTFTIEPERVSYF